MERALDNSDMTSSAALELHSWTPVDVRLARGKVTDEEASSTRADASVKAFGCQTEGRRPKSQHGRPPGPKLQRLGRRVPAVGTVRAGNYECPVLVEIVWHQLLGCVAHLWNSCTL